jgi:hypothetical protein
VQVIIYAPNAASLIFDNCPKLEDVMIWSEQVTRLAFPGCHKIKSLQYRCEKVESVEHPPLVEPPRPQRPEHVPLSEMVQKKYTGHLEQQIKQVSDMLKLSCNPSSIPAVYRGNGAVQMCQP